MQYLDVQIQRDDRLKDTGRKNSGRKKKRVFTERSRSDSDPHRGFDSPFLMSASFLRGPQIVRYRLCNSQRRVIDGNWKDGAAANGKDDFLPGQVNLKTPRGASLPRHAIPHLDGYFVTSSGNCQSGNATRTNKINSHIGTFRHHLKSAPSYEIIIKHGDPIV